MSKELIEQLRKMPEFAKQPDKELQRIAGLTEKLRRVTLFKSLNSQELAVIAQCGRLAHGDRGEIIIREGDNDKVFYVIVQGQVRVWSQVADGQRRLLNYHEAGDYFGELAFLNNRPRAATVDVVDDVELVCFDQEGFDRIVHHGQISEYMRTWSQERMRRSNRQFDGKHWDEISVILTHKNWIALARLTFFPIFIIVLTWTTMILLGAFGVASFEFVLSVIIAVTVGMGLWIFWMYEDWRNDDFIVTSKRIIHIERVLVPPFPVERHEVPIDQVLDITTHNHGLWTVLFQVRSLEVKTAGAGVIQFSFLRDSERISEEIFHCRDLARSRRTVEERSRIRQALLKEIDQEIKSLSPLESGVPIKIAPEPKGLLKLIDYFIPRTRVIKRDQIIWRKHWLILVKAVGGQALLVLLSLALLVLAIVRPGVLQGLELYLTIPLPVLGLLAALGWYLWRYDGWRNDIYIVTDSRIIDIVDSPFHLREGKRVEGTFDIIQSTNYDSPNWFTRILRMGNVTISTAAKKDAFTFDYVERPEEVQQEIFKRLMAYREQKARTESERQNAEFAKWFGIYHRSASQYKE